MPYTAKQGDGENWVVVGDDGDVKATHTPPDAKAKAERQAELLNSIADNPSWDEEDK